MDARRIAVLASACCLSVGSHYGAYLLGPLKTKLQATGSSQASESSFAALVESYYLFNTVSPLVAGRLVPVYGSAACGLVATGAVALGLAIVLYFEHQGAQANIYGLSAGFVLFGTGLAPLAVVQESIILAANQDSSAFVARSVAFGLVLGKSASFAAASTAVPLAEQSLAAPFLTALLLALFSFGACVLYTLLGTEDRNTESAGQKQALLDWRQIADLGDPFWWYAATCFLAGSWYVTLHLAPSLMESVYDISRQEAAGLASIMLGSSILLYPILGWLLDKRPCLLHKLFLGVAVFNALSLVAWLCQFRPPVLAILPTAIAVGSGPLLLVVVVPTLVEPKHASTALGIHKALEMAGAIIVQSCSSYTLRGATSGTRATIVLLLLLASTQLAAMLAWFRFAPERTTGRDESYIMLPVGENGVLPPPRDTDADSVRRRGTKGVITMAIVVPLSWVVFIATLVSRA